MRISASGIGACICLGLLHLAAVFSAPGPAPAPFPLQLEMRVPFEPTAFAGDGRRFLTYELYITNFTPNQVTLRRLEILASEENAAQPIAAFQGRELDAMLQRAQMPTPSNGLDAAQLMPGCTVVAFVWIALDATAGIPATLRHRLITSDDALMGASIETHHSRLHVLEPPLEGSSWRSSDGPSDSPDNHHRRGIFLIDGRATISRRYAIDWQQVKNGATFSGDPRDRGAYYGYGKPVFAVADARVLTAIDGRPENVPGHFENFHPAIPITTDTAGGNAITLDLGDGQFAHYFHLQPGSLQVKSGDRVHAGQLLARVGASGDAREPHLHFEVTTSPAMLAGEGLPYLINRFSTELSNGPRKQHDLELPLDQMVVDFAPPAKKRPMKQPRSARGAI
jgi:hypothetical protein